MYRFYHLPYNSPTIGLYFYSEDYIKFVSNLKDYLSKKFEFIDYKESKYCEDLVLHGNIACPIARLGDIEVVFLHYKTAEEACVKWERRKLRINWNNIFFKMTEQNFCTEEHIKVFDSISTDKKFIFVSKDHHIGSQVFFTEYLGEDTVKIDTVNFRRYVSLTRFLNGRPFRKNQPSKN